MQISVLRYRTSYRDPLVATPNHSSSLATSHEPLVSVDTVQIVHQLRDVRISSGAPAISLPLNLHPSTSPLKITRAQTQLCRVLHCPSAIERPVYIEGTKCNV